MTNLKNIHIGSLIEMKWKETGISMERTCSFLKCQENDIKTMFAGKSIDIDILLRWSKLLEYDFFRLYTGHLILYAPPSNVFKEKKISSLPEFRKNVYTKEIIDFIMELLNTAEKTKQQIIEEYKIPKTTLYKWVKKYNG